jgi:hypothetical protein
MTNAVFFFFRGMAKILYKAINIPIGRPASRKPRIRVTNVRGGLTLRPIYLLGINEQVKA